MACQYYWGGGGGRVRTNEPELHILFLRFNSSACIYIYLCAVTLLLILYVQYLPRSTVSSRNSEGYIRQYNQSSVQFLFLAYHHPHLQLEHTGDILPSHPRIYSILKAHIYTHSPYPLDPSTPPWPQLPNSPIPSSSGRQSPQSTPLSCVSSNGS